VIHYHGTPCGGKRDEVAKFLAGRHALVPWTRAEDLPVAAEVCQSFMLDNGAFGAWKSGQPITNWEGYYKWVQEWSQHPGRLHGLRMLDPAIFHRLPLASADSTNAVRNANQVKRFGMYCPPTLSQRMATIADRIEAHQSAAVWLSREEQGVLILS
jgi:hypothetical protein